MDVVEQLMGSDEPVWYRGSGRVSFDVAPSLFRHPDSLTAEQYGELEAKLLRRFRERSIPYQAPSANSDAEREWERLFVMQHFGVPTRLLDWTENPYIGLFFALSSAKVDFDTQEAEEDACVWALSPQGWNRSALSDISYDGEILSVGSPQLESFLPSADAAMRRVIPVAMYGLHNSPRIVAQRGVFTIFGSKPDPMDVVAADNGYSEDILQRITIPMAEVKNLLKSLTSIGVTDSVIYPDLGGLALELKRYYGYRV